MKRTNGAFSTAVDVAERVRLATSPAIRLEGVSVRFQIPVEPIPSFKEYVIRRIRGRIGSREIWALRGINLQVGQGEAWGIIGRNGSGKSTLLKVIARVLRPTSGRVWVRGRVAPLLELGGGFHPELTGRENIFLNAALLGHSRRETKARFDWIVDFAELWDFIDAPLRTYSTGMVARLGFAVATAWEPDILLVDEVLAVGDQAFQKKCQARLAEFRQRGTTVLLVSHSPDLIKSTCEWALWLDRGRILAMGPAEEVIAAYTDPSRESGR